MKYERILLKISGEAIGGHRGSGFDASAIDFVTREIAGLHERHVQIALVIGAGNIFRGDQLIDSASNLELHRVTADQIGMLGTVMNALVLRESLERLGIATRLFATHQVVSMTESYDAKKAREALARQEVVFCTGGTGNPLFTTDTAACLRGIELDVNLVLKGTKVDGVYDRDPATDPLAQRKSLLSYDEVIAQELQVMDLSAILLCREHKMPLIVYKLMSDGALRRVCEGETEGTLVTFNRQRP